MRLLQQDTSTELFAPRLVPRRGIQAIAPGPDGVDIVKGHESVLAARALLAQVAQASGQSGALDSLQFFLSNPAAREKTPYALLIPGQRSGDHEPLGAVTLFEYRIAGAGARVFATADGTGRRNVIAPPMFRAQAAAVAARTLIERGAHVVQISFCETHHSIDEARAADGSLRQSAGFPPNGHAEQAISAAFRAAPKSGVPCDWAFMEREIPAYLPLLSSFDATLARIGQKTRSNLRYYRRRAKAELGAAFVPDPRLTLDEFLAFNRESMYAVEKEVAMRRFRTLSAIPNCLVRGLRDANGRWLSLVGIRHHGSFVEIDWQMNRNDLPASSLGNVMRAWLIEHEIGLGRTRLYIEGGTHSAISRSFLKQRVGELTVRRKSGYAALLRRFASLAFPPTNYVGQTLARPDLLWKPW